MVSRKNTERDAASQTHLPALSIKLLHIVNGTSPATADAKQNRHSHLLMPQGRTVFSAGSGFVLRWIFTGFKPILTSQEPKLLEHSST